MGLQAAVGASRAESSQYFFDEIGHYVYAGDTALHLAAACHSEAIVRMIEDTEDLALAENALRRTRSAKSLRQLRKELGLDR